MSVKEVTYYQIVCDEPGCTFKTGDGGEDFSAWSDANAALEDWSYDHWRQSIEVDGELRHYCEEHVKPEAGEGQ